MALSFCESCKKQTQQMKSSATTTSVNLSTYSTDDIKPVALAADADVSFTKSDKYVWYNNYTDEKLSYIDEQKNITVDSSQINISQEENSQFIPFEMDRYYDGIDLTEMLIQIHYINKNKEEDYDNVVNCQYSADKIRFAWLVDKGVTYLPGDITFEIRATGVNEKGDNYCWISRPNGKLNVMESLTGNGIIKPDSDWYTGFINTMNSKISEASAYVDQANAAATRAETAANNVETDIADLTNTVKTEVMNTVTDTLSTYYNKEEVDQLIENIDVSDQLQDVYKKIDSIDGLAKFNVEYTESTSTLSFYNGEEKIKDIKINTNPTAEWVNSYNQIVDGKITTAVSPVSEALTSYKQKNDAKVSALDEKIGNIPESLQTDYYKKTDVDALLDKKASSSDLTSLSSTVNAIEQTANANKKNVTTLSEKVVELETKVDNIGELDDVKTYDATYEDEKFTLWEIQHEGDDEKEVRTAKSSFKITGGSGGGGTTSTLKIEYVTTSPVVITTEGKAIIKYNFSGVDSSGDQVTEGTYTWKIGSRVIATGTAISGENTFDATQYVSTGSQKLLLSIVDDAGTLVTKSWTVQVLDVRIESSFNDKLTYNIGPVSFDYTPYGALDKTVHFWVDGKELYTVETRISGTPISYNIAAQEHGAHLVEVYLTAEVNGETIESNHIKKDIIWYDPTSDKPVIGCIQQTLDVQQYDTVNIEYTVYDPTTESPVVTLAVDGKEASTLTLDSHTQVWQYKPTEIGNHVLTITCRGIVKTINATVEKLDIDVEPVTAGLVFDFNPVGRSNNDANRLWSDGNVAMTVSENFDWANGGWQIDENGDQYFGIKAGTKATISYNLFADDARRNGKEFKFIFKTTNVAKADATFLSCESAGIGLQMNVHEAYIKSSAKSLYVPYSEEDIIEWEFNINKDTDIPIVMAYEDGTPGRPMSYTSDYSFTQETPAPITIGSDDCDVLIYRMKAYNTSLSSQAILTNFICDARTATEMIDRYKRNQIYDENQSLTPEHLAEACPDMRIIMIEAPYFTNDKKNFVKNTSMECIYKNGDPTLDNWKYENCYHAGQGTTSNEYGQAGRNIDVICCADGIHQINSKIDLDPDYKTKLTLGDGTVIEDGTGKISLTRNSIPNNWWNFKLNIASSDMVNNAYSQNRYNTYLPYSTPATRRDSRIKNDMEFVNCVIFIKENDPDVSTHREFQDCEYHFYGLANMGDSKKTDISRAYDPDDMKEFCIEVSDNTLPNSTYQTGVTNLDGTIKYPISKTEWASGNTAYDSLYNNWDGSFEFRYDCCGDSKDGQSISSDEEKEKIRTNNRQIWRDFYEFVITSTDEEFVNNLKNWFIVESATYFYLYTLRYTMIDNRAKNVFYHWAKHYITTEEASEMGDKANYYIIDDAAAKINNGYRFDLWDYDNDTGWGINNSGELTMTYGKEDTDYRTEGDPSSGYVFNAAECVFFCRIRNLMGSQLRTMYASCESKGCWSATSLINQFDSKQNEWCEELWRLDYVRKYERTYRDGNTRFLEQMMNGKKKYQRRQFERDQEIYMATKFVGTSITSDQIMFRCNTPVGAVVSPDYTLHLTPYSNMYLDVMFGNSSVKQIRAKAGQTYDITCPYTTMDDTAVLVYAASRIQSMGDVSTCYIHDNDFSKAEKLKELIIGNTTEGYSNTFLTNLVIGNNKLLEKLDIRNTPNLTTSLDFSKCLNLKELYATGSGLTGVLFANGGKIATALLPDTLTSIKMQNLMYLTDLEIAGYDKIATMVLENCNVVDCKSLIEKSKNVNRVRITGINWTLTDTSLLDKIYGMKGIDRNGYNTDQSVLAGAVHVPVMREKKLAEYKAAWPDLELTYDTLVEQFTILFKNDDGSILDTQYVDKGETPVNPLTREENPISTPTKKSTAKNNFTFAGWDKNFIAAFSDAVYTATYTSTIRKYTIRYISKGTVKETITAEYGSTVFYSKDIPVYTAEESAYKYYLFDRWDSSGYVTGDKDINAVFDSCEYVQNYFKGKDISTMRPVEIYAMTKLAKEQEVVSEKDSISFDMGTDYTFEDIKEKTLISQETVFTGSNYVDTKLSLIDEDKDFVLAVDYMFATNNTTGSTLMQCYKSDGSLGFKLWQNTQPQINWNTSSTAVSNTGKRDILVIRHIAGEKVLHVYQGNLPEETIAYSQLTSNKSAIATSTLVFGCSKADDGAYENYGKGTIYWAKLWNADLGDTACRNLAAWTHESIELEMYAFKRYYLSDNSGSRTSMSFISSHVLSNMMRLNATSTNAGGWAKMDLNKFLNGRFYNAIPVQWRQLLKQAKIQSTAGEKSSETVTSNCYVAIPAAIEVEGAMNFEPYNYEGSVIPFITSDTARVRTDATGTAVSYWLRSPNIGYNTYVWSVNSDGSTSGYKLPNQEAGVVIILSI